MPNREYHFWVYILSSSLRNLYVGMTNNLIHRVTTHQKGLHSTHTGHYNIDRLVYYEYFRYVRSAIARETALKHTTREQKVAIIEKTNPTWHDLLPELLRKHQQNGGEPEPLQKLS